MTSDEIVEVPAIATDCPYVEVGIGKSSAAEENPTKRVKFDSVSASSGAGKFFFGNMGEASFFLE
jgi:hypothetical protein